MRRKNIMLIIPEMSMGGAQRSLSTLSLCLQTAHNVNVVIFNRNHDVAFSYGGNLFSLDVNGGRNWFQKSTAFISRVRKLKKLKSSLKIDVAVSFLEGADFINVLSRNAERIIISIRGSKLHDETISRNFYFLRTRVLIPLLYRFADHIVTVNRGIAKEMTGRYRIPGNKVTTIHNFYDLAKIEVQANEKKPAQLATLYDQKKILISVARLAPEKGIDFLIQLFGRLLKTEKDLIYVIVGDGPEYENLKRRCFGLAIEFSDLDTITATTRLVFAGNQSNVYKFLNGACICLLNSSSEGFPNALVEAAICKVPIVSSDCPYGPREILAPELEYGSPTREPLQLKTGLLLPPLNNEKILDIWHQTVADLLADENKLKLIAGNAYKNIRHLRIENMLSFWEPVFDP